MAARIRTAVTLALAAAALTACASAAASTSATSASTPGWRPRPDAPYQAEPGVPQASPSGPGAAPAPGGPGATPAPTGTGPDPAVLATGLRDPTGLVLLPGGTALVGERTTGRILQVQPQAGQPTPVVATLPGLDAGGDGGLLDLAVSPHYAEDDLVYAYVTTATDNEVVTFTLGGPVTPVVTGIPRGSTGNAGRIAFDPTGDLVVATGPAGRAPDPASLAGKVLRYDDIGRPATDDPVPGSPVLSGGLTGAEALCLAPSPLAAPGAAAVLVGSAADGRIGVAGPGRPAPAPLVGLPAADPGLGGCAVGGDRLYVTSRDGRAVLGAPFAIPAGVPRAGALTPVLAGTYGRLRTVVAAPDGTLWLTTSNRDGHGTPVSDDDRVVRITPGGGGTGSKA